MINRFFVFTHSFAISKSVFLDNYDASWLGAVVSVFACQTKGAGLHPQDLKSLDFVNVIKNGVRQYDKTR